MSEITEEQFAAEKASKDRAYEERNRLVAFLAFLYPSSLERHPAEDLEWENDWRWIVFVDLPTGQATWHIHDSHLPLFSGLPELQGRKWDGHSTEEKYRRVEAAVEEASSLLGERDRLEVAAAKHLVLRRLAQRVIDECGSSDAHPYDNSPSVGTLIALRSVLDELQSEVGSE